MIGSPFAILRPYENEKQLCVALFTKSDDIRSDADGAKALGVKHAAGLHQVHGNRTMIARGPSARTEEADGMITDAHGLALCLRIADCQSFIVYAPERRVVGLLHVGWRGLIANAIPEFFRSLDAGWGIDASATFVAAGPSLCLKCAGFSDPKEELPNIPQKFIHGKNVDLQGAATAQLLALGVRPERFERHPDCTCCRPETYWTYRGGDREQVKKGRTNMLACTLRVPMGHL